MPKHKKHQWLPYFYEISYVGDGKNVNYVLKSVYCPECELIKDVEIGIR